MMSMRNLRVLYAYIKGRNAEERRANDAPYVAVCQRILKREWDVLKAEIRGITEEDQVASPKARIRAEDHPGQTI